MKHLFPFMLLLLLCSCRHDRKPLSGPGNKDRQQAMENMKRLQERADYMSRLYKQRMQEPDISKATHEVYRFVTDLAFGDNYIFRVDRDTVLGMRLTTKFINTRITDDDSSLVIVYKHQLRRFLPGAVIDSSVQSISAAEWSTFIRLLDGSYYRRIGEPACPEHTLDPRALVLEAMTPEICPQMLNLKYYRVHIQSPRPGSFMDACVYLSSISILTRHIQRDIWKQYFPKGYRYN